MFKNLSTEALGISGGQSEIIELALSFGFRGIDLDLIEFSEQVKSKGLPQARRLLDSAKLKLGAFKLPVNLGSDEATFRTQVDQLPSRISALLEVGARRASTQIEAASDERPYHENFQLHQQRLTDVARKLEPLGVRLGVGFSAAGEARQDKPYEFIYGLEPLLVLLSMVPARNVGVELDLWHLWASGESLALVKQKLKAEQIVSVLVADARPHGAADAAGPQSASTRLLPGETGLVDTPAALVALAELGYDGPVTPAPHSSRFAGMRRDSIVKLAGEKLDTCWKAAGLTPAGKLAAQARR